VGSVAARSAVDGSLVLVNTVSSLRQWPFKVPEAQRLDGKRLAGARQAASAGRTSRPDSSSSPRRGILRKRSRRIVRRTRPPSLKVLRLL
jgi:hypothetical protein